MRRLGVLPLLTTLAAGCQACPPLVTSAPDDAIITDLGDDDVTLFCREQATYVFGMLDRETYERGVCLHDALSGGTRERRVTDAASCEAFVAECIAAGPYWPGVTDCGLGPVSACNRETIRMRRACVTEQVCTTWPTWANELDCAMFGTPEVEAVFDRASPTDACVRNTCT
jgi:hypothetical protein